MINLKTDIPEGFLEEEERCGFVVKREMKEVWAIELDLFSEFDRVCKKYSLPYVASGGTILGTIRHAGFIPWDDDIDLMMLRADYEKLCKIAPSEFNHPYFFQTEENDPGFMRDFARLRNSLTTGIQMIEYKTRPTYNQGIFIDIFPMDAVIDDEKKFKKQVRCYDFYHKVYTLSSAIIYNAQNHEVSNMVIMFRKALHVLLGPVLKLIKMDRYSFRKTQQICQRYNQIETKCVSLLSLDIHNLKHSNLRTAFNGITYKNFEFVQMPIPSDYEEHLKKKYGDYMTFKRIPNFHGDVIFDTNISYVEFYNNKKK
jgi:lipopolysaccharide cholinephosphotransferase